MVPAHHANGSGKYPINIYRGLLKTEIKEMSMPTTIDVASKAVALACAHVSNLVTISSFNPLSVNPNNLFLLSLSKIGVSDTGTFLESLTEIFPQFKQDLQQMTLTTDTTLALVVTFLESLLDAE